MMTMFLARYSLNDPWIKTVNAFFVQYRGILLFIYYLLFIYLRAWLIAILVKQQFPGRKAAYYVAMKEIYYSSSLLHVRQYNCITSCKQGGIKKSVLPSGVYTLGLINGG